MGLGVASGLTVVSSGASVTKNGNSFVMFGLMVSVGEIVLSWGMLNSTVRVTKIHMLIQN